MVSAALPHSPSHTVFRDDIFVGKVAFVTGGGSGICNRMTAALMRHGASSVILGRKFDRLQEAAKALKEETGKDCLPIRCDVRNPEDLVKAAQEAVARFGRLDFVICGAAGNFLAPIEGLSTNAFKTVIEIDVLGTYNTVKATLPYVKKTQGSYIHVSATLHYYGSPYQVHVSAAKAAIDALNKALAVEMGPSGVRTNVIAPGPIAGTEGMDRLLPKNIKEEINRKIPLQKMGEKGDVANAAVFLFSPAASWITGAILVVDGGDALLKGSLLPYPESVLNPPSVAQLIVGSKL